MNLKRMRRQLIIGLTTALLLAHGVIAASETSERGEKLSISLKARSVVLGPEVKLGDIGKVLIPDHHKRAQLASIVIGQAPPPGESSEISLTYIKRCLKLHGFEKYLSVIEGPRTVRIITAHVEIDKAFLREEFARNYQKMPAPEDEKFLHVSYDLDLFLLI